MCEKCDYAEEVIRAVFAVLVDNEDISTLGPHHPADVRLVIEGFNNALSALYVTARIGESILGTEGSRLLEADANIAFDADVRAPMTDAEVAAMLDAFEQSNPDDFRI